MLPKTRKKVFSIFGVIFVLGLVVTLVTQIDKVRQLFSRANQNSQAPLNGTYLYLETLNENNIPLIMSELESLKMDTVITTAIVGKAVPKGSTGEACRGGYYYVSKLDKEVEKVRKFLDSAQSHNIKIYFGLIGSMRNCSDWYKNDILVDQDAEQTIKTLRWIKTNFPDHPAIAGWSIFNEAWLGYEADTDDLESFNNYYKKQVVAIRTESDLPIVTAPTLSTFDSNGNTVTPDIIAKKADYLLERTGVDILIFQDGLGAVSTPLKPWSQPYTLKDYLDTIAKKIGSNRLWADIELFTYPTGKSDNGGGNTSASISRISTQINETQAASKRVVWIQQSFMSTTNNDLLKDPNGAQRLLDTYRAVYRNEGGKITPQQYTWVTQPNSKYPDTGNKLFDELPGDPKLRAFAQWVGINGPAEIVFTFSKKMPIWWVSFHVLHNQALSIAFPNSLSLFCSQDQTRWESLGTWNLPVNKLDSEYVFSNSSKLTTSCQYLKARLENPVWTFVSEVEIVGPSISDSFPTPQSTPNVINKSGCDVLIQLCRKQGSMMCEMAKARGCL